MGCREREGCGQACRGRPRATRVALCGQPQREASFLLPKGPLQGRTALPRGAAGAWPQALPSLQRVGEGGKGLQLLPLKARPRAPTAQLFLEMLWTFVQQKLCRQPRGCIKVLPVLAGVGRGHHRRLLTCSGRPSVGSVAKLFTNPLVCTHPALVLGSVAQTRSKAQ